MSARTRNGKIARLPDRVREQLNDRLRDGDHVLLLAAGTGYTWAAAVVRWGEAS